MAGTITGRVTRRDMRREATKAAVLDAARKVFLSEGFDGATIKAIADEAGVSPGTVLNAEPTKAALLVAILHDESERISDTCEQMEGALSGPAPDRIAALLHVILDGHVRHAELFSAAIGHAWLSSDGEYHDAFEGLQFAWDAVRRAVASGVRNGDLRSELDADDAFIVLHEAVCGALRVYRRGNENASESLSRRLSVILGGLRA